MPGRPGRLTAPTLLGGLMLLAAPAAGRAHRLEAECHVLEGHRVQVESWFDLTGQPPRGARVEVYRPDGSKLTEGTVDDQGRFIFSYTAAEPLRVVVSAGQGHRKEVTIPAADLGRDAPANPAAAPTAAGPPLLSDRSSRISAKDVLTGVSFLLAVAAFALSVRNARQLRRLRRSEPEASATGAAAPPTRSLPGSDRIAPDRK